MDLKASSPEGPGGGVGGGSWGAQIEPGPQGNANPALVLRLSADQASAASGCLIVPASAVGLAFRRALVSTGHGSRRISVAEVGARTCRGSRASYCCSWTANPAAGGLESAVIARCISLFGEPNLARERFGKRDGRQPGLTLPAPGRAQFTPFLRTIRGVLDCPVPACWPKGGGGAFSCCAPGCCVHRESAKAPGSDRLHCQFHVAVFRGARCAAAASGGLI